MSKGLHPYKRDEITRIRLDEVEGGFSKFIVNLRMAKYLKELGFDKPTHHYYQTQDNGLIESGFMWKSFDVEKKLLNHNAYEPFIYSAPTIEEGFEWAINKLRELIN